MAAGHGDVYHIQFSREYNSDNDSAVARSFNFTSFGAGFQFDLRHHHSGGTIHTLVFRRNTSGLKWSNTNCNLWGNT